MFLGTPRWMWIVTGVLLLVGLGAIAMGRIPEGLLVLGAGLVVFALSPSGPKRDRRRTPAAEPVPPIAPSAQPIRPAPPAPPRQPLDIEAGDPSQV